MSNCPPLKGQTWIFNDYSSTKVNLPGMLHSLRPKGFNSQSSTDPMSCCIYSSTVPIIFCPSPPPSHSSLYPLCTVYPFVIAAKSLTTTHSLPVPPPLHHTLGHKQEPKQQRCCPPPPKLHEERMLVGAAGSTSVYIEIAAICWHHGLILCKGKLRFYSF